SDQEQINTANVANIFPLNVSGVPFPEIGPNVLESICINLEGFTYEMDIFLQSPSGQILELTTGNGYTPSPNPPFSPATFAEDYTNTCFTLDGTTAINFNPNGETYASGEDGPFTNNYQPETPFTDLYGSDINGTWELVVYYGDLVPFNTGVNFIDWSLTFNNVYSVNYEWTPATDLSCTDCFDPIASPSTTTTYTLVVVDSYGCEETSSTTINVITQLDPPNPTCTASPSGSITVTWDAVPGADTYEVNVDGGGWIAPNPGSLTHTVTGLTSGQVVNVEVRGISAACGIGQLATIDCTADTQCSLSSTVDATSDISCFGADDGTANLSNTGGTGTVTYDFGGGNSNTTGIFIGLPPNTYTVSITDDLCSVTEIVTIIEPTELSATQTFTDVSCNGNADGTISVSPSGGTPPYIFAWDNGITDTDGDISSLSPNTYSATITDDNGCTITITQIISENPAITLSTSQVDVECNGVSNGTATVSATGGTGTYTYQWDANAANQTTATATGLGANTYSVTVTDGDACEQTTTVTIIETSDIVLDFSHTPTVCSSSSDGSITLTVSGGTPSYTFAWNNGVTTT
ncbi:MAG: hypothetical protein ACPG5P_04120, partial [Saprospiraceae bacterium]